MTQKRFASKVSIVLGVVLMTMSCQENGSVIKPANQTANSQSKSSSQIGARIMNYTFDGTEGGAITLQQAGSWVVNYSIQSPQAVRSHFFGATVIKKVLSTTGCVGIRIYYSLDDYSNKQLLLIGADVKGNNLLPANGIKGKASSINMSDVSSDLLSGTEGDLISEEISKQWMANHATQNPNSLIGHFFGFEIINQILNQADCIGIRTYYAVNDAGIQQVLLVGVNSKGQNILPTSPTGGRTTDGGGTVGDMSFPCPSYCSGS